MMKNISDLIKLSLCLLIMFITTGCPSTPPPNLSHTIRLIKFEEASDKDYILANYVPKGKYSTGEYARMMSHNMCTSHRHHQYMEVWDFNFPESHHLPYWELPNGWLLVDWRYHSFPHYKDQTVTLNQKWETLYEYDSWFFPKDMIRHKNPISAWIEVDLHLLETFLDKTYSIEVLQLVNQTKNSWDFYDVDDGYCSCEIPEKLDSIWAGFQLDLFEFIEAGNNIMEINKH